MNTFLISLTLVSSSVIGLVQSTTAQPQPSAVGILQKSADKLNSVKTLGYAYSFEYSYPSKERRMDINAQAYLDLKPGEAPGGFRFQFLGSDRLTIYNGSERFTADEKTKKLWVESSPSFDSAGDTFLLNSPIALQRALPAIIRDPNVTKEIISSDAKNYIVAFHLKNAIITSGGEIQNTRSQQVATFRLTLDAKTFMPAEVLQSNDQNDEAVKVTFGSLTERPVAPGPLTWYYSSYLNKYKVEKKETLSLIGTGATAPLVKLAEFGSKALISTDQFKGRPLLLEFWIAQCHFCISAVPKLNKISQRFGNVQIVSVNMHDSAQTIQYFKDQNRPEYSILTGGDSIAKAFGVEAYPAFVLIAPDGRVAYASSGLDEKELEAAILLLKR